VAPPLPTVFVQGQGVASADQLNTPVQTVASFAQLRTFTALDDMCVMVLGGAAEGDGYQGLFWYDSTSTAVDNSATAITPTGAAQGAWLLLPPGSQSPGAFATLSVSGAATIGGNLSVGGTLTTAGVATFQSNVLMTGTGEAQIPAGTTAQRPSSPSAGMIRYNTSLAIFEGYGSSWLSLGASVVTTPPCGRLTLASGVPVLSSAMLAASGVIWTPYNGAVTPQWNGSAWTSTTFTEISQALSDTTNSPAAAVAGGLYDMFIWFKSGAATLSRGPAWTNSATRSLAITPRVGGFLTNAVAVANGPAAGYGLYVGTIACDAGGATVTFNPTPAAASGGPSGGAWVGLWNAFNQVAIDLAACDSKALWSPTTTATWERSDNSANNRVSFVIGVAGGSVTPSFQCWLSNVQANTNVAVGLGVNSTSAPSAASQGFYTTTVGTYGVANVSYGFAPPIGLNYIQALQYASNSNDAYQGVTLSAQMHQLLVQTVF
jgi:hypothetical protein